MAGISGPRYPEPGPGLVPDSVKTGPNAGLFSPLSRLEELAEVSLNAARQFQMDSIMVIIFNHIFLYTALRASVISAQRETKGFGHHHRCISF